MGIDPVTHKPFSQILSDYGNISGISSNNGNPIGSFNNKTLNNTDLMMISKTEPFSVLKTEPCFVLKTDHSLSSDIIKNSTAEQVQDFFVLQPNLYNEVSSSACSSSSSTTQLNSPRSFTCKQFQPPISTPPSPCLWSEFLLSDPVISAEFQQQQQENDISNGKFATGNDQDQFFNKNGYDGFGSYDYGGINGNQANNYGGDAYSSSASSFVDGILDKDREMGSQFPQILDPSFDY